MTDQVQPAQGPGTTGPGPDGAGFTYRGAEQELIVVARPEARLRARAEGVRSAAGADVSALNMFLTDEQLALEPLFGSEERLQQSAVAGTENGPDLALFYRVRGVESRAQELRARIAALPEIDTAYVKPGAVPASTGSAGWTGQSADDGQRLKEGAHVTPDFTSRQGYLRPAPEGIDAYWAWQRPGGSGRSVTVIDVEGAWQLGHEDLASKLAGVVVGTPVTDIAWRNHGTAVIGVIGGDRNEHGTTGIAPDAVTAAASFQGIGTAAAIHAAAERLSPGDIILVELHAPGPRFDFEERDTQEGYIALEWWPDNFAAVQYATARGILVVAAAGNGAESLDDAVYERRPAEFPDWWRNPFNPSNRSSGAILVGAGAPPPGTHGRDHGPDRSRLAFSNYGARVDAQGWGREVTTTGGFWDRPGDLQGGAEEIAWYTDTFSGTSSASPVVVGALASLQGMLKAAGQAPMSSERARAVLRATGSPQQDAPGRPASQRIGNRPDIKAAVTRLLPEAVGSGQAERYWDELLPYPRELPPRLRLYVSGAWRNLNNPSPEIRQAVHSAFAGGRPDVRVWFSDDEIVGLVVTG
ncbi:MULTISPECIES: S8 family peptidase [unclassified Streptomyces]|uniref:S8 family peptidase n=1 Tax=unclassified Streptomyces TaxID=2593676 RepID=UPI002255018C|nr:MULTISPECIES: S8 family peptidase [unclassified Streptomyces]MCX4992066.1 S8 family serine peptidase [Streptomyces sp. NBC_00568]MCX5002698.1 S8 family serine peptidase [Streptomyces sp. NBC_00638]